MSLINLSSAATGVTAAGATLATATVLKDNYVNVTTVAAATGVSLPGGAPAGTSVFVRNSGANALSVYPATAAGTINGGAAGAAKSLAVTDDGVRSRAFVSFGNDVWVTAGVA